MSNLRLQIQAWVYDYNVCNNDAMRVTEENRIYILYINDVEITKGDLDHVFNRVKGIMRENGLV